MAKLAQKEEKKSNEGTVVKSKDIQKVVGTGTGNMKKGKVYEVHKLVAEKLIERGFAEAEKKGKETDSETK